MNKVTSDKLVAALFVLLIILHSSLVFSFAADPSFIKSVDTIADLKSLLVTDTHDSVNLRGYLSVNDGGGGVFELDPASAAVADGGIYIAPNAGPGRWKRAVAGRDYLARWWGPTRTNATLQSAIDYVSANGYGKVIADGGTWTVKSDDSTRITMKSGVTLVTAEDSQIVCAPNPTNNWILIDFPSEVTDCGVGPARLVGWNLAAPGGDTNRTGFILSIQETVNVTVGGVKASNWYTQYAKVGSGNENLLLFDENWERGVKALGAKGYPEDDTKAIQAAIYYAERYNGEVIFPAGTNSYLMTTTWVTNGVPITIKGDNTLLNVYYSQPGDVTNSRFSAAFIISSANVTVDGLRFTTISTNYNRITEETSTSGYYAPINIHLATNVVIKNCTFDVRTGRGILSSGSYTVIEKNRFLNGCGFTFGVGQPHDWLYFHNLVPLGADPIYYSPIGCRVTDNYFTGSNAWKHICHISAADKFTFSRNQMIDIGSPVAGLIVYSGDVGITDARGTNVYEYGGTISDNTITGHFGRQGAIQIRLNTPTNYVPGAFNPELLHSSWIVANNHISGIGKGYNLIKAKGTKIKGGDCRVTQETLFLLGDCDPLEIDGGYYETTGASASGSSIALGNGYLAPANFKNVKLRNATFVVGPANGYWMRHVNPPPVDSLTIENCDIFFYGAVAAGDAPKIFQFTQTTNFIALINNRFYVTNGMNGRSIGQLAGTNCDFTIVNNKTIPLSSTTVPKGPQVSGRTVTYRGNDLRSFDTASPDEVFAPPE